MDKFKLIVVMLIWGSIGVFSKNIELSPIVLAFFRASAALPVIFAIIKIKKIKPDFRLKHTKPYIITGLLLGLGWAAFFFGIKNTSIASAVLIYNLCPIYIMILAPIVLKEKLHLPQAIAIVISFIGLFLIVGVKPPESGELMGMLLSGLSGVFYAVIVIINKKNNHQIESTYATLIQIAVAALVLLPITFLDGGFSDVLKLNSKDIIFTILLGVLHTGIAYSIYFSVYKKLKSIDIVSFSYLEPVFAIILSCIFLGESMAIIQIIGGLLILSSTYLGERLKTRSLAT